MSGSTSTEKTLRKHLKREENNMNYFVHVYLFTEMDEYDQVKPIQYNLDEEDLEALHEAIKNKQNLIPFGADFQHSDNIIKLSFFKTEEKPFVNFDD